MIDLQELRDKRAGLVAEARKMQDDVDADEKRKWSAEDEQQWNKLFAEADEIGVDVERRQKLLQAEKVLETAEETGGERTTNRPELEDRGKAGEEKAKADMAEAFRSCLREGGRRNLTPEQRGALEKRALQSQVDTAGGFTYPDEQFLAQLIQAVDDQVLLRRLGTVQQVTGADSLGVPSLDNDPADSDWTTELLTGSEDSTMDFGKRELNPHPLAKRIKVSNTLLERSALPIDAIVRERLAYKFAVTEEKAFLTGTGAQQPLGIFTASALGISTGRDVSTDNSTTAIAADNLIECKYTLKGNYWQRANWIFHRDAIKNIRKLKDGDGQYLWRPGLQSDQGDTILDVPVQSSEFAPNTFTTGLYVGIIGDMSLYWIADALSYRVKRLEELYAETNQVGYITRAEIDGMPVLEEAFVRVTLA